MFAVMVIEDDEVTRRLTCQVLRRGGYDPIPASDGVEALELMDRYHVDLFLLDIMMPGMDGFEFIRTVRGSRFETPILMTTAKGSLSDKRQAFPPGRTTIWSSRSTRRNFCSGSPRCSGVRRSRPNGGSRSGATR